MGKALSAFIVLLFSINLNAQRFVADSLLHIIATSKTDSVKNRCCLYNFIYLHESRY